MTARLLIGVILAAAVVTAESPLVERVADTGFIQLKADSFSQLDARHQALAYWLMQAAIAIDPIIYDQLSQYGIREKRLLEGIVGHPAGIAPRWRAGAAPKGANPPGSRSGSQPRGLVLIDFPPRFGSSLGHTLTPSETQG